MKKREWGFLILFSQAITIVVYQTLILPLHLVWWLSLSLSALNGLIIGSSTTILYCLGFRRRAQ